MRVCVVTYWFCNENYGQLLQCYAYQHFLEMHGNTVRILRYRPDFGKRDRGFLKRLARVFLSPGVIVSKVLSLLSLGGKAKKVRRLRIVRLRKFDEFRSKMLNLTPNVLRTYEDIQKSLSLDEFDLYSVGSDVVWGGIIPLDDDGRPYFLDFGNKNAKRIAYSASFGATTLSEKFKRFARPFLCRLDAVSVREDSGVLLCKILGFESARAVLDPVFLLPRQCYFERFGIPDKRKDFYCYVLQTNEIFPLSELEAIANEKGANVSITTVYSDMGFPLKLMKDPTIPEWIRIIGSSEFFVTNSFHGLSMALILHTPFAVILKHKGLGMDSRLVTMLERAGLGDRIVREGVNDMRSVYNTPIDWCSVDERISIIREESIGFLREVGLC